MLKELATDVQSRWQRSLPVGEYLVDRWERARVLGFGEGASIYDSAIVIGSVSVGANTWIGPWAMLDGSGGLSIGSHCSISAGVQIYTHDSVAWAVSGGERPIERAAMRISDRCYARPECHCGQGRDHRPWVHHQSEQSRAFRPFRGKQGVGESGTTSKA
jgi:hypothetical protein